MKPSSIVLTGVLASILAGPVAAQPAGSPPPAAAPAPPEGLRDPVAQAGYAIGLELGRSLRRDDVAVDPQVVARGIKDGLAGGAPMLTEDQMRSAMSTVQVQVQARRQEKAAQAAAANRTAGAAYLKANGAKPGVVTLPSGLEFEVLKAGTGPMPKPDDTVVCNYRGTLINGTEFDSSYTRGVPATLNVSHVIKGWTEALQRMPVGSKWRLVIPADLAYGDKGAGADIGPGAVLVFEVELLSIQPPA